jgi:hypothetical protein
MSFSAEIKDFVGGFKAGAAVGGDARDAKLSREKFEFDRAFKEKNYGASSARADRALNIRERALDMRASDAEARKSGKAAKDAAKEGEKAHKAEVKDYNELTRSGGSGTKAASKTEYADDWEDFDSDFPEDAPEEEWDESAIPTEEVSGEEVRLANTGGLMEASEGEDQEAAASKGDSGVAEAAIPTASPADPKPAEGKSDPIFKETAKVTKEVMDEWNSEVSQKEEAVSIKPKSQDRIADVAPASPEEMKAMWAKVDPNGELDGQMKGAKTLVNAYKFFMEKGDAVKAKKIAGQIIKFNQMASMTQGQLALDALRAGDLVSASKLVSDAYNENVPDGGSIKAEPTPNGTVLYKIDRAGFAQQQGELGAKQMWELASGVANGSQFIQRMSALAGEATVDPNEPGPVVTDESKSKGKKRTYSADVATAAQARKSLDAVQKKHDQAVADGYTEEELAPISEQLSAANTAWDAAWKTAQKAAKATKRPRKTLIEDLRRESSVALPGQPAEATEEPADGAAIPDGASAVAPAKADAAAIPEMPTAPTPAASGKPIDPATMAAAKAAIEQGRSRAGVLKKLQDAGYDTRGL